jgi:hypothetical protein
VRHNETSHLIQAIAIAGAAFRAEKWREMERFAANLGKRLV